jgi:hypothetical protein
MLFPRLRSGRPPPRFGWRYAILVLVVIGIVLAAGRLLSWVQDTLSDAAGGSFPAAGEHSRRAHP